MKKREFLRLTGIVGAGVVVSPFIACNEGQKEASKPEPEKPTANSGNNLFELPALGYAFDALQPSIDARTMEIHHGKHHAGYVKKLNAALEGNQKYQGMSLSQILSAVTAEESGVRNNGGGHYNHSLYWEIMAPGGGKTPAGKLLDAINSAFGDYNSFADAFFNAAKTRFGSGWAWLSADGEGKLSVSSTANQDNPMMTGIMEETGCPVLGIDVWEHAYYLNYQNRRGDYIKSFMEIINWEQVSKNYDEV